VQRDDAADAPAPVLVTEEAKPAISLEELVTDLAVQAAPQPEPAAPKPAPAAPPALRTARVLAVEGRKAKIAWRGSSAEVTAALAPEVERDLIEEAAAHKDAVLVEVDGDQQPVVVGVVQTRRPREVRVTGEKVVIEGSREVLLRAGRAALRLREDGDVELVGSRISAASRGLFRIVGRILRLN
jgi:hypothetical protein